jgi:hypothetical protein
MPPRLSSVPASWHQRFPGSARNNDMNWQIYWVSGIVANGAPLSSSAGCHLRWAK